MARDVPARFFYARRGAVSAGPAADVVCFGAHGVRDDAFPFKIFFIRLDLFRPALQFGRHDAQFVSCIPVFFNSPQLSLSMGRRVKQSTQTHSAFPAMFHMAYSPSSSEKRGATPRAPVSDSGVFVEKAGFGRTVSPPPIVRPFARDVPERFLPRLCSSGSLAFRPRRRSGSRLSNFSRGRASRRFTDREHPVRSGGRSLSPAGESFARVFKDAGRPNVLL